MSGFEGKTAIVTGAGSGIGAALCQALGRAGAQVVCSDIDGSAAAATASALGGSARAVTLDVTDADGVSKLVEEVVSDAGRLDLMFNNAGIAYAGETIDLTLEQWNRIIDINLRGVVHGVVAAYPVMVRQGSGHIVNTASMAGLMAAGLMTSYVATKHAVVGLSLALRSEAAAKGVGVTVVCPGAVDTPILDKGSIGRSRSRDVFLKGQGISRPYDVDRLAAEVLAAVARNRGMVVSPRASRAQWFLGRMAPRLIQRMAVGFVARQRALVDAPKSSV